MEFEGIEEIAVIVVVVSAIAEITIVVEFVVIAIVIIGAVKTINKIIIIIRVTITKGIFAIIRIEFSKETFQQSKMQVIQVKSQKLIVVILVSADFESAIVKFLISFSKEAIHWKTFSSKMMS